MLLWRIRWRPITPRFMHSAACLRQQQLDRQVEDVVPGDLAGTLERHRVSNRGRVIRKHLVAVAPFRNIVGEKIQRPSFPRDVSSDAPLKVADKPIPQDQRSSESSMTSKAPKAPLIRNAEKASERLDRVHAIGTYLVPLAYRDSTRFTPYLNDDDPQALNGYER